MIKLLAALLPVLLVATACTTRSKAQADAQRAFQAGQKQALKQQQQPPVVIVRGDVRNQFIPWTEDLTLAKAILAAQYTGYLDPRQIVIIRKGVSYPIDVKQFVRGGVEDPPLEPGDTVEVRR